MLDVASQHYMHFSLSVIKKHLLDCPLQHSKCILVIAGRVMEIAIWRDIHKQTWKMQTRTQRGGRSYLFPPRRTNHAIGNASMVWLTLSGLYHKLSWALFLERESVVIVPCKAIRSVINASWDPVSYPWCPPCDPNTELHSSLGATHLICAWIHQIQSKYTIRLLKDRNGMGYNISRNLVVIFQTRASIWWFNNQEYGKENSKSRSPGIIVRTQL